ncbi:hypothetical protein AB9F42_34445, partial [Rhizobium leguminosarum]
LLVDDLGLEVFGGNDSRYEELCGLVVERHFGLDRFSGQELHGDVGSGAIAAFKAAGVDPVPPVTGNDETIAALQLIIAGDQYNTISKPS